MRVLLVDNYDSFTYNIAHLLSGLGAEVTVLRNDDLQLHPRAVDQWPLVVVGPGPGRPSEAGMTMAVIEHAAKTGTPLFGVCLGQQAIGQYFGGEVVYAPSLMHGKTSEITHDGTGVFRGIEQRFIATRYHSLCVAETSMPTVLHSTAHSDDGVIQGLAHGDLPIHAVQFHPESILTVAGAKIMQNMLEIAAVAKR